MSDETKCNQCSEPDETETLRKCPVCHKLFCEAHAYHMSGRPFCSLGCAQYFFFAEPDD